MPRKTFANGFPLPASDLNTYLMDQSVQTYADATARTAALATPVEGQMSYLADTNTAYVYDGSSWNAVVDAKNYGSVLPNGAAGRNKVINGDFSVWQRGTSFTSPSFSQYTADRWKNNNYDVAPTTWSVSRESFTPGTAPSGSNSEFFYRSTITTVGSNTVYDTAQQRIEDVRTFAGQTVTLSFWAKADSARTVTPSLGQSFGSGGSTGLTFVAFGANVYNLTTSWQRFTLTATVPSITGKTIGVGSYLWFAFRQTSASGSVLDISDIQLEAGSVATPFATATGTKQGELAACQRYFYKMTSAYTMGAAAIRSSTLANPFITHPVEMRVTPTYTASGSNAVTVYEVGTYTSTALGTFGSTPRGTILDVTSSGMTAGRAAVCNVTSGQTIEWSAEL
jgi:hypothetical protein